MLITLTFIYTNQQIQRQRLSDDDAWATAAMAPREKPKMGIALTTVSQDLHLSSRFAHRSLQFTSSLLQNKNVRQLINGSCKYTFQLPWQRCIAKHYDNATQILQW